MKSAKGPSNLHSPFSAPGLDSPLKVTFMEVVVIEVGVDVKCARVDGVKYDKVGEKSISITSAGNDWAVGVGKTTWSGDMVIEWYAGRPT